MSNLREKAEAQTKRIIGQMLGDELLVREGQEELRHAEGAPAGNRNESRADDNTEGARDRGKRRGFQTDRPKPRPPRAGESDQGIVRDERGQEQPKDKERAQHVSRVDRGGDPPGRKV
jgi:hypothetical protein